MNPFDDPSQKGSQFDDDGEPPSLEEWDEEEGSSSGEAMEEPRAGKRPRGSSYGGKYPASRSWMKTQRAKAQVDLAAYFGPIPPQQQIAICRAYASLLSAQHRGLTAVQKKTSE
nr:MAG: hypothetical protein [Cressdnaviricota sp.]